MKNALDRKKNRVLYILEKYPESRNCDKTLMKFYITEFHAGILEQSMTSKFSIPLESYHLIDSPYNVVRMRQKCQEEGKFLPTSWEVAKKRKLNEIEWKAYMIGKSAINSIENL